MTKARHRFYTYKVETMWWWIPKQDPKRVVFCFDSPLWFSSVFFNNESLWLVGAVIDGFIWPKWIFRWFGQQSELLRTGRPSFAEFVRWENRESAACRIPLYK